MLEDWIVALRKLGDEGAIASRVAAKAAPHIREALAASLAAGTSAEGEPWAPRKKDGGRAYAKAAAALEVAAHGDLIRATISGPTAFGPYGVAGAPKRPMLPDTGGSIPPKVLSALDKAAQEVLDEAAR